MHGSFDVNLSYVIARLCYKVPVPYSFLCLRCDLSQHLNPIMLRINYARTISRSRATKLGLYNLLSYDIDDISTNANVPTGLIYISPLSRFFPTPSSLADSCRANFHYSVTTYVPLMVGVLPKLYSPKGPPCNHVVI